MVFFGVNGATAFTGDDERLGGALGGGVSLLGGGTASHRQLYRNSPWVNTCVNRLSRGVAKTPLKSFMDNPDKPEERERLRSRGRGAHPLAALLARPWEGGTSFRLLNAITLEYLIEKPAVALVWKDRDGSPGSSPKRLIPLRRAQVIPQLRSDGRVGFYEWREHPNAEPLRILPEDMMRVGFEDGVSPLEALTRTVQIDEASQRSTAAFYENGAVPGSVLTTEARLQPDAVESIEEMLRSNHKGASNHHRTMVLANLPGAQWYSPGVSSNDAQTVEHRKLAREEIAAGYNVPQPIAGILDRATFSNIETQTRMWVVDSLGEHFAMLESAFNGQLVDAEPEWDGCFVEFDPSEILRGAPLQRAESYLKWLNSGTRTPNELRRLENLPPIEDAWADAVYLPVNLTPVGLPGGRSNTPGPGAMPDGTIAGDDPADG